MKKITLKRQPVFRRQPEQAVVRPDLVQRLDAVIQSLQPPAQPRDYLVELHRCLQSKQWKAQTLSIKKIGLLPSFTDYSEDFRDFSQRRHFTLELFYLIFKKMR
jgi:hypothetical protein